MLKGTHLRGFLITFTLGIGFIMMTVVFLGAETSELTKQLIAVLGLVVVLISSAALIAWLARKIMGRKSL